MKNKWENYAIKDGKIKSSYIREYCNRSPKRQAREASCGNRLLQGGESSEEEIIIDACITNDEWISNVLRTQNESGRKENPSETHQEGRQGVPRSDQGRCETQETNRKEDGEEKMKKQTEMERKRESKGEKMHEKKEKMHEKKEKMHEKKEERKEHKKKK